MIHKFQANFEPKILFNLHQGYNSARCNCVDIWHLVNKLPQVFLVFVDLGGL